MGLDIAVRDRLAILEAEELTHSIVRVNRVTLSLLRILELVRLNIGAERLRDIRRSHLRTVRLAEERAELLLQRNGGLEDGRALAGLTLRALRLALATTTATSLLYLTRNTLAKLLERLEAIDSGIAHSLNRAIRVSISCCTVVVGPVTAASTADASGATTGTATGTGVVAVVVVVAFSFFALTSFTGAVATGTGAATSGVTSFFTTFLTVLTVELIFVLVPVEVFAIFKRTD